MESWGGTSDQWWENQCEKRALITTLPPLYKPEFDEERNQDSGDP